MTDTILGNLGPILLGVIVVVPLVQLTASLLLRPTQKRLLDAISDVIETDHLSRPHRAWLRNPIETSSGNHLLIVSFFAPFAIFGAVALGIYDGFRSTGKGGRTAGSVSDRIDNLAS